MKDKIIRAREQVTDTQEKNGKQEAARQRKTEWREKKPPKGQEAEEGRGEARKIHQNTWPLRSIVRTIEEAMQRMRRKMANELNKESTTNAKT